MKIIFRKNVKNEEKKIRPAKGIFDGAMKPFIRGADKNHNPRKGTETQLFYLLKLYTFLIRTIIPVRGRKLKVIAKVNHLSNLQIRTIIPVRGRKLVFCIFVCCVMIRHDKNHNPRKGTETLRFREELLTGGFR